MNLPVTLQHFNINDHYIEIFVPEQAALKREYDLLKDKDATTPLPYWAQVWPSAIALSTFITNNTYLVKGKKIIELAGGLGLPSIIAAKEALLVTYSDYLPEAVSIVQKTVNHNRLNNVECKILNWHNLPPTLTADVLLLSDINYNPEDFEALYNTIKKNLQQGTTIIISTPQRLLAKPFINQILNWCIKSEEMEVFHQKKLVQISTLVLKASL